MPLYNVSIDSIANAIVTLNRALEHGVIEADKYKDFSDYLEKQKNIFQVRKSHLDKANWDLDEELESEAKEFFMEESDVLYKMAEELLEEHEYDLRAEEVEEESDAQKAWAKMSDKEREKIAALASEWQKSR